MSRAVSLQRESGKLRNAARRLAKKGFRAEAGKMMAASEMSRMREPNIMTPEFRRMDSRAQDALSFAQQAASSPDFDYERDILPMRQAFFQDTASLPRDQQRMITDRYAKQFTDLGGETLKERGTLDQMRGQRVALEATQQRLKDDKRKFKQQRKTEKALPDMSSRLDRILSGAGTSSQKEKALVSEALSNPKFYSSQTGSNLIGTAFNSITRDITRKKSEDDKATGFQKWAAQSGATEALKLFKAGDMEGALYEVARHTQEEKDKSREATTGLRLQAVRDKAKTSVEKNLGILNDTEQYPDPTAILGYIKDALRGSSSFPEITKELQRLLKIVDAEKNKGDKAIVEDSVIEDLRIAFGELIQALSASTGAPPAATPTAPSVEEELFGKK